MDFIDFLIKAKLDGYATGGEGQELIFTDGPKGFEYSESGYRYVDRYYGFSPFAGTEYVYDNKDRLIWAMNYFGRVAPSYPYPGKIYRFLKKAMSRIDSDFPFRGPASYESGSFRYVNDQTGTIDRFHGVERIFSGEDEVYSLHYHGGSLVNLRIRANKT